MIYKKYIKRPMDFALSLISMILLSPLFLIIAVLVRTKLGSPVIYRQKRPGLNEKIFTLYKFRTMTEDKDENGNLLPNHKRHTAFGKFLRSTSLDELPELFNILKGDMSIVGPRPLLIKYLPLYNAEQKRRHDLKPGLTGLAQIKGRNKITWENKFAFDIKYIDELSFFLDIKIILQTIYKSFFIREGINSSNDITMEEFKGTKKSDS